MTGIAILTPADFTEEAFAREVEGEDFGIPASVIVVDAAPGEGPSLHTHTYAELFFVIDGQATFTDGPNDYVVFDGGVVLVAPGQPHAFTSSGSKRLRQIDVHLNGRFVTHWLR
jgi:mannose-6-phosphate isomerase-like protein (cupin superfamily)